MSPGAALPDDFEDQVARDLFRPKSQQERNEIFTRYEESKAKETSQASTASEPAEPEQEGNGIFYAILIVLGLSIVGLIYLALVYLHIVPPPF
jgi:hypothetical protein